MSSNRKPPRDRLAFKLFGFLSGEAEGNIAIGALVAVALIFAVVLVLRH